MLANIFLRFFGFIHNDKYFFYININLFIYELFLDFKIKVDSP